MKHPHQKKTKIVFGQLTMKYTFIYKKKKKKKKRREKK
jgi:hypothetical protein